MAVDLQDYSALSIGFHYCKFRFDFYNDDLQTTSDYNDLDWHHSHNIYEMRTFPTPGRIRCTCP
jgi:hypothetical protein